MNIDEKQVDIDVPEEVANDEFVARIVIDPKYLQDGKLGSSAFDLRDTKRVPDESYVSVMRMNFWNATEEISKFRAPKGNRVIGYAKMLVSNIRGLSGNIQSRNLRVDVKSEKNDNPGSPHAGIFTLIDSKIVTGAKTEHAGVIWSYVRNKLVEIAEFVSTN